jgi:DNA-binding response OmpR family regulator
MYTVFVVEDDRALRDELLRLLTRNGYATACTDDFAQVVQTIEEAAPDLVLLDLTLPVLDGQVVCRELRKVSHVPIMIVTSRDDDMDELICLNLGADAFVTKPYNAQVLLARITSLLRRAYDRGDEHLMALGAVTLDPARGMLSYQDETIELTKNELRILHHLMNHAEQVVSRTDLMNELWQSDEFVDDNTLTVNVNRLRHRLAAIGVPASFLQTRRGLGYRVMP